MLNISHPHPPTLVSNWLRDNLGDSFFQLFVAFRDLCEITIPVLHENTKVTTHEGTFREPLPPPTHFVAFCWGTKQRNVGDTGTR